MSKEDFKLDDLLKPPVHEQRAQQFFKQVEAIQNNYPGVDINLASSAEGLGDRVIAAFAREAREEGKEEEAKEWEAAGDQEEIQSTYSTYIFVVVSANNAADIEVVRRELNRLATVNSITTIEHQELGTPDYHDDYWRKYPVEGESFYIFASDDVDENLTG